MHILVVNDDGPPSNESSPYIHSFVQSLQRAGHQVSVCLPHQQRSWIGKAHIVGQAIRPTYFRPGKLTDDSGKLLNQGETAHQPLPLKEGKKREEWILIDSTPASCVQIGLFHYFKERGPIDLVVSGPNYGRNTTAVFALSSGTLGGAMEAAICGVKAIALSYAFVSRDHDAQIVKEASDRSTTVIEYLVKTWDERPDAHVYSVNTPLIKEVSTTQILWTDMLQNKWVSGSSFQEIEVPDSEDQTAGEAEREIRTSEELQERPSLDEVMEGEESGHLRYKHKHFKWAPRFKDVYDSVTNSAPGNDGWAVKEGYISVTPLRANFMHVDGVKGELKI